MFNKIKSLFPEKPSSLPDATAHKKEGDEHLKLGRIAEAAGCYGRALAINPDYVDACVGLGFALSEQKNYAAAERYLQHALLVDPNNADAHYILGTIAKNRNDQTASVEHLGRAIDIKPDFEFAYRELIAALFHSGEVRKAKDVLHRAVSAYPVSAEFHFYLGNALRLEGDGDGAAASYRKALSLQPASAESHKGLADALRMNGQLDLAGASYRKALALQPEFVDAHADLGSLLRMQGKDEEALACYKQVVRLDPNHPVKHLVAALSGGESERAPGDYVERLFDGYAQRFDSHLVQDLSYADPEKLAALLPPHFDPHGAKWTILDLGCGTGLSGAAIAPFARELVGVDLSSKMLDKAREKNLYHRLERLDLVVMMQGERASSYDLVFATDVFIYVGKLDDVVSQVARLLRPGGLFAFSVESLEALTQDAPTDRRDYRLSPTGRYAHSKAYLAAIANREGLELISTSSTQSRIDKGKPVQGHLVLMRRLAE